MLAWPSWLREVQLIAGLTGIGVDITLLETDDKTSSPEFARSLGSSLKAAQGCVFIKIRPVEQFSF